MATENFGFGERARLQPVEAEHELELPPSTQPISVPVAAAALGMVVLALILSVFWIMRGGEEVSPTAPVAPDAGTDVVPSPPAGLDGVAQANDAQAQATLQNASRAAMTLHAETADPAAGFTAVTPEALATEDPSSFYATAESTGPDTVSVASTSTGWAAAVASDSGTCYWIRIEADVTTFGTGSPCTGEAAMAAADTSW